MKIYRFDRDTGKTIDRYHSSGFVLANVAHFLDEPIIHCAYLDPQGVIGFHQAGMPQLFLVLQGEGWVRGEAPERKPIRTGQAAYWAEGEWHEAGTEAGMMAMIIEATHFDISEWIPVA